ncbi:hypothetical protein IFM89_023477 [Coptis chinensis]|uniref:ALG11 mannosyltransferase N-terminal domain-containing protein n=1 Tax=Coptis chinensis TaxID=261450 RepID=A0A835HGQ1_9MAGN|nr:hypothetical protein IFM89_023477 [Coptis chinensis]
MMVEVGREWFGVLVKAIQEENPNLDIVIYTGDHDATPETLMVFFCLVMWFTCIEGSGLRNAPTLVSLWLVKVLGGSVYLAWEALCKYTPSFYFDTSGYAFTYPLARIFGYKVICYTHYPTISTNMVSRVWRRSLLYNNDALVANSYASEPL